MYIFRPYTERVLRLRDAVRDRLIIADPSKYRIQMEAEKLYKKYPPILQKAYMNRYVMERIHLNIQEDEFFVGSLGHKGWGEAHAERWMMVDIEQPDRARVLPPLPLSEPLDLDPGLSDTRPSSGKVLTDPALSYTRF